MRVLILGGTAEARALASQLVRAGADVISSLAGRVQQPRLPEGPVRIGGFGGASGLAEFLRAQRITAVVDATHPFAAKISANAAAASAEVGVSRMVLRRSGWALDPSWQAVPDIGAAAEVVRRWPRESVFLTTGRRDLAVFAGDSEHRFLVRAVDPPQGPLPPRMTLILDRGPYTVDGESALLQKHTVSLLVTKDSGGEMTVAKLKAARALGVPVLIVRRPPVPADSEIVETVEQALAWLRALAEGSPT